VTSLLNGAVRAGLDLKEVNAEIDGLGDGELTKARVLSDILGKKEIRLEGDKNTSDDVTVDNVTSDTNEVLFSVTNADNGDVIKVTRHGVRDNLQHHAGLVKLKSMYMLTEMLESSVYFGSLVNAKPDVKNGVTHYNYYINKVRINGIDYIVNMEVSSNKDDKTQRLYNHILSDISFFEVKDESSPRPPADLNQRSDELPSNSNHPSPSGQSQLSLELLLKLPDKKFVELSQAIIFGDLSGLEISKAERERLDSVIPLFTGQNEISSLSRDSFYEITSQIKELEKINRTIEGLVKDYRKLYNSGARGDDLQNLTQRIYDEQVNRNKVFTDVYGKISRYRNYLNVPQSKTIKGDSEHKAIGVMQDLFASHIKTLLSMRNQYDELGKSLKTNDRVLFNALKTMFDNKVETSEDKRKYTKFIDDLNVERSVEITFNAVNSIDSDKASANDFVYPLGMIEHLVEDVSNIENMQKEILSKDAELTDESKRTAYEQMNKIRIYLKYDVISAGIESINNKLGNPLSNGYFENDRERINYLKDVINRYDESKRHEESSRRAQEAKERQEAFQKRVESMTPEQQEAWSKLKEAFHSKSEFESEADIYLERQHIKDLQTDVTLFSRVLSVLRGNNKNSNDKRSLFSEKYGKNITPAEIIKELYGVAVDESISATKEQTEQAISKAEALPTEAKRVLNDYVKSVYDKYNLGVLGVGTGVNDVANYLEHPSLPEVVEKIDDLVKIKEMLKEVRNIYKKEAPINKADTMDKKYSDIIADKLKNICESLGIKYIKGDVNIARNIVRIDNKLYEIEGVENEPKYSKADSEMSHISDVLNGLDLEVESIEQVNLGTDGINAIPTDGSFEVDNNASRYGKYKRAMEIAGRFGHKVVVYKNGKGKYAGTNGFMNNGVIYINSQSKSAVDVVLRHELVHAIKTRNIGAYNQLRALVKGLPTWAAFFEKHEGEYRRMYAVEMEEVYEMALEEWERLAVSDERLDDDGGMQDTRGAETTLTPSGVKQEVPPFQRKGELSPAERLTSREEYAKSKAEAYLEEELIAQFLGENLNRGAFWDRVIRGDKNVFYRLADAVHEFFMGLGAYFKGKETWHEYVAYKAMEKAVYGARDASMVRNGVSYADLVRKFKAYHGGRYFVGDFSLEHVLSGNGLMIHGYGLYFTDDISLARLFVDYLKQNTNNKNGAIYEVNIYGDKKLEDLNFLDLDATIEDSLFDKIDKAFDDDGMAGFKSFFHKNAIKNNNSNLVYYTDKFIRSFNEDYITSDIYDENHEKTSSEFFKELGYDGFLYHGEYFGKRNSEKRYENSTNYVIFDDGVISDKRVVEEMRYSKNADSGQQTADGKTVERVPNKKMLLDKWNGDAEILINDHLAIDDISSEQRKEEDLQNERKKAYTYAMDNFRDKTYIIESTKVPGQQDSGVHFTFSRKGIQESFKNTTLKDIDKIRSIYHLPKLCESSIFFGSRANTVTDESFVKSYEYYLNKLTIGKQDYLVKLVFKIYNDGTRFYDHDLTEYFRFEKGSEHRWTPSVKPGPEYSLDGTASRVGNSLSSAALHYSLPKIHDIRLRKLCQAVFFADEIRAEVSNIQNNIDINGISDDETSASIRKLADDIGVKYVDKKTGVEKPINEIWKMVKADLVNEGILGVRSEESGVKSSGQRFSRSGESGQQTADGGQQTERDVDFERRLSETGVTLEESAKDKVERIYKQIRRVMTYDNEEFQQNVHEFLTDDVMTRLDEFVNTATISGDASTVMHFKEIWEEAVKQIKDGNVHKSFTIEEFGSNGYNFVIETMKELVLSHMYGDMAQQIYNQWVESDKKDDKLRLEFAEALRRMDIPQHNFENLVSQSGKVLNLAKQQKDKLDSREGVPSDVYEALKAERDEKIEVLRKAMEEDHAAIDTALADLSVDEQEHYKRITDRVFSGRSTIEAERRRPLSVWELIRISRYANLLSGVPTHIKNMFNTAGNVAIFEPLVGSITDLIVHGRAVGWRGLGQGFVEGGRAAGAIMRNELPSGVQTGNKFDVPFYNPDRTRLNRFWNAIVGTMQFSSKLLRAEDAINFTGAMHNTAHQFALELSENLVQGDRNDLIRYKANFGLGEMSADDLRAMSVGELYHHLLDNPTPEMVELMTDFSLEKTYNQKVPEYFLGAVANFIEEQHKKLDNYDNTISHLGDEVIRMVMPFTRVVANVTNNSIAYTPVGFLHWLYKKGKVNDEMNKQYKASSEKIVKLTENYYFLSDDKKAGIDKAVNDILYKDMLRRLMSRRGLREQLAKAILGSLFMAIMGFFLRDKVSGGGGGLTREQRDQMRSIGWQPNSIQIGNRWFSYTNVPGVGLGLALIGNFNDAMKYKKYQDDGQELYKRLSYASLGLLHHIFDQSFLSGLADVMEMAANNDIKTAERFVSSALLAPVPFTYNIVKYMHDIFDPDLKNPQNLAQTMMNEMRGVGWMLGWCDNIPTRINVFGERQQKVMPFRTGSGTIGLLTGVGFGMETVKDPVLLEMAKGVLGAGIYLPASNGRVKVRVGREDMILDGKEREDFLVFRGLEFGRLLKRASNKREIEYLIKRVNNGDVLAVDKLKDKLRSLHLKANEYGRKQMTRLLNAKSQRLAAV